MDSNDSIELGRLTDLLATATRTSHVAIGISSLKTGLFAEVNEAFCRLHKRRRDEIIGRSSAELGLWADPAQRERLMDTLQRQGSVSRFETRYRDSNGETGDLEVSARIVRVGDEAYLIGFLTDVTDRREMLEGLRAAQARLGVVMRASNVVVFRQDRDLRITWLVNPALGATEDELIGRTDEELMGTEAALPLVTIKRRVLETGVAERRDVWVANKGHLGCFDMVVEPEHDAAGRVVGILCAAQDITQRMSAQQAALNVPATAIQGMAALIGREALTARQAERLRRIDREAGRLLGSRLPVSPAQRLRERHAGALVLVAEDNLVLRELLRDLLELTGLRVVTATSGVEAFSFTMQLAPALLLLDMDLPQGGGVAAARAVRTMSNRPLPILGMWSTSSPMPAARALDADLDDVLDKPVGAGLLYEKVLSWLEAR